MLSGQHPNQERQMLSDCRLWLGHSPRGCRSAHDGHINQRWLCLLDVAGTLLGEWSPAGCYRRRVRIWMFDLHGEFFTRTPVIVASHYCPLVTGWTSYVPRPASAWGHVQGIPRPAAPSASRRRKLSQVVRDGLGPCYSLLEPTGRGQTNNGLCNDLLG
jgi:hypothetical protein